MPVLAESVRATAAWALGQMDLSTAPKGLIDGLSSSDDQVRVASAWALSEIGDPSALPAVRTALAKEQDPQAQKAELRALINGGEKTEQLTQLLQSKDPAIRKAAIQGIAGSHGVNVWPWPQPRPRPFP